MKISFAPSSGQTILLFSSQINFKTSENLSLKKKKSKYLSDIKHTSHGRK